MPDRLSASLGRAPQTIAVFRALKLGDLLCAVPAFRALRQAFPQAHIALISLPWAAEFVARFDAFFDEFIAFPGYPGLPEQPVDPARVVAFLSEMQARNFDVVFQIQGNGTLVNAMLGLFGAKRLAGYYPPGHVEPFCPDPALFQAYPTDEHEVKRHVGLMEFLKIPAQGYALEFPLTLADERRAIGLPAWLELDGRPFVGLHPGGISARRWPPERFARVGDALVERGYAVVLTGTPPEVDTVEKVRAHMGNPALSVAGQTDLGSLGWLLSRASLLVSNDTGVAHVASALRVPSVVIYTTSRSEEWGALDATRHRAVREAEATVERVVREADELLSTLSR